MVLKDLVVTAVWPFNKDEVEVSHQADLLCDFYLKCIGRFYTPETAKVVIMIIRPEITEINGFAVRKDKAVALLDVVEYRVDFDFPLYDRMMEDDRRKYLWLTICDCMLRIGDQLEWDRDKMEPIFQKGIDTSFGLKEINRN